MVYIVYGRWLRHELVDYNRVRTGDDEIPGNTPESTERDGRRSRRRAVARLVRLREASVYWSMCKGSTTMEASGTDSVSAYAIRRSAVAHSIASFFPSGANKTSQMTGSMANSSPKAPSSSSTSTGCITTKINSRIQTSLTQTTTGARQVLRRNWHRRPTTRHGTTTATVLGGDFVPGSTLRRGTSSSPWRSSSGRSISRRA